MRVRGLRAVRAALAVGSIGALALLTTASTAGAGIDQTAAPLTIVKTVSGPVPAGTTFTATITCDDNIIVDNGGSTDTVTVTFDASGQPTSPDTFGFDDPGACDVTETVNGGASTTMYACESTIPEGPVDTVPLPEGGDFSAQQVEQEPVCVAAGPQTTPITVNINDPDQTATVTIHNTFVAATPLQPIPAAGVVAAPTFTG